MTNRIYGEIERAFMIIRSFVHAWWFEDVIEDIILVKNIE